jgi:subtilisin family serine protease
MGRLVSKLLIPVAAALLLATALASAQAGASAGARYIVQLSDPPLASYRGGVAGLPATNPAALGRIKLDPTSPASVAYLGYLTQRQAAFLAAAEQALGHPVAAIRQYRYAFNGVATTLTETEADRMASLPGVERVEREQTYQLHTDAGPAWIGAPSIWDGSAVNGPRGTKGEGVVVGVIDTGVNHDHPSFADVGGDGYNHLNPRGTFYGLCAPVTGAPFCNDKLIGVWDFTGTSPEDDNGHGSHTASTVAGNVLDAVIHAPTMTLGRRISGVAPHANLITYKACDQVSGGCRGVSLTAAIDQATADAVDVINYSIGGGSQDPWNDSSALAFLGARDAGIFVSASAGNDGPKPETIGSPSNAPWLLSVGASTHNRKFVNKLAGMSGGAGAAPADIAGKSITRGYGPARIVYAGNPPYDSGLCGEGPADAATGKALINPFEPGTFNGEIVVCDRGGGYGRIEKAENVMEGGAGGFVLANDQENGDSLVGDAYPLPGVHISYNDGVALKAWLASGTGHTASISGMTPDEAAANGDVQASFSSRGPDKTVPDVLKPDITAPGVDILAAFHTPATNPLGPPEFSAISGTSMSSPHMAGAATLVRALHNSWTPAEVQSALMTTSLTTGQRKEDGLKPADPFDRGAGRVDLAKAGKAGLVLNETTANYEAANPALGGDPTTLNTASLADADCRGTCTWTRTVESTVGSAATWRVTTSAPRGVRLTVQPARFTLAPGGAQTITVTANVLTAPQSAWSFGELRLTSDVAPAAHLPIAVYAGGAAQPVDITATGTTGSHTVATTSEVAIERFSSVISGLAEGKVVNRQLEQDPTSGGVPGAGTGVIGILSPYEAVAGTFHTTLDAPSGARFLKAEITQSTAPDIDLFVGLDQDGDKAPDEAEEVCRSASGVWQESCTLKAPATGTWWILVQNWAASARLIDDVQLTAAVIPGASSGNLTATGPTTAVPKGQPFDITLTWNEPRLEPGDAWFALVEYGASRTHPDNAGSLLVKIARPS